MNTFTLKIIAIYLAEYLALSSVSTPCTISMVILKTFERDKCDFLYIPFLVYYFTLCYTLFGTLVIEDVKKQWSLLTYRIVEVSRYLLCNVRTVFTQVVLLRSGADGRCHEERLVGGSAGVGRAGRARLRSVLALLVCSILIPTDPVTVAMRSLTKNGHLLHLFVQNATKGFCQVSPTSERSLLPITWQRCNTYTCALYTYVTITYLNAELR